MRSRPRITLLGAFILIVAGGWMFAHLLDTGASMQQAAEKLLASLTPEQRAAAQLEYDSPKRVDWHFVPKAERKGLPIKQMDEAQRKAAQELLQSSLSHSGYGKATTIMALEAILRDAEKGRADSPVRDHELYYFTIFGKPAASGKWGWGVEGHHLSVNFSVVDGHVFADAPMFLGANPADVRDSTPGAPKIGTRVLGKEEDLAFALLASLTGVQRTKAVIATTAPRDIRAAGEPQPPDEPPAGVAAEELTTEQVLALRNLINVYADNMPDDVAKRRIARLEQAGVEKIHFAWAGANKPGIGHYYRIQGPTFVIELCNNQPDAAGNPANHVHSVWRDMEGDFGLPRK